MKSFTKTFTKSWFQIPVIITCCNVWTNESEHRQSMKQGTEQKRKEGFHQIRVQSRKFEQEQEQEQKEQKGQEQEQALRQDEKQETRFGYQMKQMERLNIKDIQLVISLDYTSSSEMLHRQEYGPYAQAIDVFGKVMSKIPGSNDFLSFYFGRYESDIDYLCRKGECTSFSDFRQRYLSSLSLVGGFESNASASIREATRICEQNRKYTVLLVITDGQLEEMISAIQEANAVPLSIIFVLVGDNSWIDTSSKGKYKRQNPLIGFIHFGNSDSKRIAQEYAQIMKEHSVVREERMAVFS